jgi:hypothetical protein
LFYTQTADGTVLSEWTSDFLVPTPFWVDIVEDAIRSTTREAILMNNIGLDC